MKKSVLVFIAFAFYSSQAEYLPTTVEIAATLGWPHLMVKLRNDAENLFDQKLISMGLDVHDLRLKDLNYRADELTDIYSQDFDAMKERFDREFERISRKFLSSADRLDVEWAPVKIKAKFVKDLEKDATDSISALIKSYQLKN